VNPKRSEGATRGVSVNLGLASRRAAAKPYIPRASAQQQNRNKQHIINDLSIYLVLDQRVFQKNVKFSATQTLEMFNI
jgi:hypothetical protein